MSEPVNVFEGVPATTTMTLIYTTPAATTIKINTILATNTTGTAAVISLEHVPSGGATGTGKMIADAMSVAANVDASLMGGGMELVLQAGDTLWASQVTASAINLNIDGEELLFGGV
jgi:hypothetical protein